MKKITKEQIKIIAITVSGVVFLLCFWIFVYWPQSKKLGLIKKDLELTEAKINEVKEITQGKDLSVAVAELNSKFGSYASLLPSNLEDLISKVSNKARSSNVEIKSISPQKPDLIDDRITNYPIEKFVIQMSIVSKFKELGDFLYYLESDFIHLVQVKQVDIKGRGESNPVLDVTLQILCYLSGAKQ
jgi:Tfp pilus assembly protein PilO